MFFCLAALYFTARGPWRALGSVNSYDFASLYGATRCWLHGENPYDMRLVARELHAAGDNPATFPNADPPPSVYFPTAFPLVAPFAWLPWREARFAWSLLSIAAFGLSAALLVHISKSGQPHRWLLGAFVLLFSPTSSGLSTGNPSVIACGLTLAAIFLAIEKLGYAADSFPAPGLLLGVALAIKPQISIAALAVLVLWGRWRLIAFSVVVPALAALVSFLRIGQWDQYRLWLSTLHNGIATASLAGGINDPSPANYFSYHLVNAAAILSVWLHNTRIVTALVWILTAIFAGAYLWARKRDLTDNRPLCDIAFFCTLSLLPVYHRYYDAQLLLGVLPLLCAPPARREALAIWSALFILLLPLQAILADSHPQLNPGSPIGFLALRHQPAIVLLLCLLLVPWRSLSGSSQAGQGTTRGATVCNS